MAVTQIEREDKYDVGTNFQVPDLAAALPGGARIQTATVRLESTYYDTEAGDLLANRITFRRRTGDTDTGWHLKLPAGPHRAEVRLPLTDSDDGPPAELADVTLGLRRGRELRPRAVLRTERRLTLFVDADGDTLVEVADDLVEAATFGSSTTASQWREVEVELGTGKPKLQKRIRALLVAAGARDSANGSKLQRALHGDAPHGLLPHQLNPLRKPGRRSTETVADVVFGYLQAQRAAILDGDLGLRRGEAAVHGTRVATRRLRSTLRVFADVFDADLAATLDTELAWYAGVLGAVRDVEVMSTHLLAAVADLPPELVLGPVAARIEGRLALERAGRYRELTAAIDSERYYALLDTLDAWRDAPPFAGASISPAEQARRYLARAERTVARRTRRAAAIPAGTPGRDEAVHGARKAAKRARYTAELLTPTSNRSAAKAVRRYEAVQDDLGEHQDAVTAQQWLRRLAATAGTSEGENGFTYGLLHGREQARATAHDIR